MTKASEVTVTDAELLAFRDAANLPALDLKREQVRRALAAFIAARVPDAIIYQDPDEIDEAQMTFHNALRAAVLRGPGDSK